MPVILTYTKQSFAFCIQLSSFSPYNFIFIFFDSFINTYIFFCIFYLVMLLLFFLKFEFRTFACSQLYKLYKGMGSFSTSSSPVFFYLYFPCRFCFLDIIQISCGCCGCTHTLTHSRTHTRTDTLWSIFRMLIAHSLIGIYFAF